MFILVFWLAAQVIWLSQYQLIASYSIADALWFVGYTSFGYFLYSLYYHFFRKEFEPFVLILIAIIIVIILVFVLDIILSTLRLLSTQKIDLSIVLVTLVYPILDAVVIFPTVLKENQDRKAKRKKLNHHSPTLFLLFLQFGFAVIYINGIICNRRYRICI